MADKTTEKNTGGNKAKPKGPSGQDTAPPGTLGGPVPEDGKVKPSARKEK